ncbi:MAG: DUF4111 domain-containing protein [Lachnospiraceae bacterium]|nr:DUF4111 domain-containing protein [Lachnospiraceae bacterium]
MKKLLGYTELPLDIMNQLNKVVEIWKNHMQNDLVGIYLHGSIVLNAFNPESGDIDILVVVRDSIEIEKKLEIAKDMIAIDGCPRPLEMSAIKISDAQNWKTPGNCVFHYSDFWTEKYKKRFDNPGEEVYVVDHEFPDADVTSYIRLINQSGVVLYGRDIKEVFCDISDEDFWSAISTEIDDYDFHNYNARYFASNILILGRILSFKLTKQILSKYDAGIWMIDYVPEKLKYLPEGAMKIWFEGEECDLPEKDLEILKKFLIDEIKK